MKTLPTLILGCVLALPLSSAAETPSMEQMWQMIKQQQQQLEALSKENRALKSQLNATTEAVEQGRAETYAQGETTAAHTRVGGYGELHYNDLENQRAGGDDKQEIDFHRFVLFFSHEFNEEIRFFSELELEHAFNADGEPGEVELEQAYLEFDLTDSLSARGGLFLVPVGILNETHEPPTFYGTERNPVEKNIIPVTWWEGGAGLSGHYASGLSFDLALTSGLKTSAASDYAVRKGRQKVAEAKADNPAFTGRVKWTGIPGLEVAATLQHQSDITQGEDPDAGSANLYEAHVVWSPGPFGLRALYAQWDLDGRGPASVGADEQTGWYLEPSFKINPQLGLFGRYSSWDNQAGDDSDSEYNQWNLGLNYWPHQDVVLKVDYQNQESPAGKDEFDGLNLGIGYQF